MAGGSTVELVTWFFAALCGLAVVARSLIKMRAIRHVGADDIFIWAAFLCFIGQCVAAQYQVRYDLGSDLPLNQIPRQTLFLEMQAQYAKHLLYMPVTAFSKLSVVSMLRKFALNQRDRVLLYAFEWFLAVWAVTSELVWAFSCQMPDPWNHFNKCISRDGWIIFFEITNSLTEFALILMPTLSIARLQIPLRKKVLATSFFWIRIAIIPVIVLIVVYNAQEQDRGFTLSDVPYVVATMVVAALEILSACVVYARPLFEILETGCFTIATQRSAQRFSQQPGALLFDHTSKGSWPFTRMSSMDGVRTHDSGYTAQVRANSQDVEKESAEPTEDIHVQRQVEVLSSNVQRAHIADLYPRASSPTHFHPRDSQMLPSQSYTAQPRSSVLPWEGKDLPPTPPVQKGT